MGQLAGFEQHHEIRATGKRFPSTVTFSQQIESLAQVRR
jgi:hypothetical protein